MNTVVVTGIGLVSPAGVDLIQSREATLPLTPSNDHVTYPEHPELSKVLPVPDHFSLKRIVKKRKDIKLMAKANQYAVAASDEAVRHAKLSSEQLSNAGIFMAVGREPSDLKALLPSVVHSVSDGLLSLDTLFKHGVDWINPLSSLKTLPNMSLAHAAIHVGARGPNMTLFGPDAFEQCLDAAVHALKEKRCNVALVGGADSCTSFYDRLGLAREHNPTLVGEGAAIFVLETKDCADQRGAEVLLSAHTLTETYPDAGCGYCGAATAPISAALGVSFNESVRTVIAQPEAAPRDLRQRVVVTGVGIVSPLGLDFDSFRRALRSGESAVGPIGQFNAEHFSVPNACEVRSNLWWNRMPESVKQQLSSVNERSASFAVSAAMSAMEDSKLDAPPEIVVYGTGLSSVSIPELNQDCIPYLKAEKPYLDFRGVEVHSKSAQFVSPHRHRMSLPLEVLCKHWSQSIEQRVHFSACAAGAGAIGHGMDLVRSGVKTHVLVGASDAMIHPYGLIPFSKLGATSTISDPSLAARPFDKERSGFVMGETAAFFLLESEQSALERGAKIYGEILGWGSSCDAHNVTAPHPDGLGAKTSMNASLLDAGVMADRIGYVNAHGTGTHLNDTAEALAIAEVFGEHRPWVSSTKGQLGHCIGAAGAIEFAVCLSALLDGYIPPNVNLSNPEPNLNVRLSGRSSLDADLQLVMSNSFGFGGQNVSLIVGRT
jgi:3-oxoacyl-[acyl-carrier-protein] synthase II